MLRLLEAELASLREDILVYEENIHVKDGIVKSLSNRLEDLEPPSGPSASSTPRAHRRLNEMEILKVSFQYSCMPRDVCIVAVMLSLLGVKYLFCTVCDRPCFRHWYEHSSRWFKMKMDCRYSY